MLYRIVVAAWLALACQLGFALDSDRDQPATLDADDFEIDLKTGVRTYRGNVIFRQGSIRLRCDELVTYLNDDGELDKAVCTGNPGKFKQRPEGSDEDMVGVAGRIVLNELKRVVTMKIRANVTQGGTKISGKTITYDLDTEKVVVKGGGQGDKKATASQSKDGDASGQASTEKATESTQDSRPSLTIQPRKKKKEAE